MKLTNKTVIITGAASGIGYELAIQCLQAGAKVLGVDLPSKVINIIDNNFFTYYCDLSIEKHIDDLFIKALELFKNIDIFIANAGFAYYEKLDRPSFKHIESIYSINTTSPIYSALKMKQIAKNKAFNFVAISSVMNYWPLPGYSLYSSTKAALYTFFKGYRHELKKNQHIHIVLPVSTKTNFFIVSGQKHKAWFTQTPKHVASSIIKGIKHDKKIIYPSKTFKWVYKICPYALNFYVKREKKLLNKTFKK